MVISIQNELTIYSHKLGYRVTKEGEIVNPKGSTIKSFLNGKNAKPYLVFSIRDLSKWKYAKKVKVHKLQAYQKFGKDAFKNKLEVRHLDGNSLNNSWDNIEIGTSSDNQMDIPKEIRIKTAIIASRKMQDSSRSQDKRKLIYEDLKNNLPYTEIMEKHGVTSKGTLSYMKNKSLEYKNYISPSSK